MSVGAVGGAAAPQLQTSWTRAEAACAARHRGDVYFELTHPQPKPDATAPAPTSPGATASSAGNPDSDESSNDSLQHGFTLHL